MPRLKRLTIVRRALKKMPRPPGGRLRSMAWLADELGVARQDLYAVLSGKERSRWVEERLSELFPALPPWPPRGYCGDLSKAIPLDEFKG